MDSVINVGMLKNPLNWVIVTLMIVLFFMGAEIVINQFSTDKG